MNFQANHSKRIVVCGDRFIGVCTTHLLAKNGAPVTLVKKSSIADAASGKAGGFLAVDWCDSRPVSSLAQASFNLPSSLFEELDGHKSFIPNSLISKAVESYGVEIVIGKVERVELEEEGGQVNSVVLKGGSVIESNAVVLALRPWSGKFELLSCLCRVFGLWGAQSNFWGWYW
ncbi:hypothetical protein G4B88_031058 [Cannabis sativa]|uniref:FAD dependent oxidoreductase domain-containing protein n=1 Tax=Cannabis sativa TaxID=3483 RepID=A0A7J6DKX5_CANSA|nr:hypothetical protein G4B88_031058 [Cannabis sativa]